MSLCCLDMMETKALEPFLLLYCSTYVPWATIIEGVLVEVECKYIPAGTKERTCSKQKDEKMISKGCLIRNTGPVILLREQLAGSQCF